MNFLISQVKERGPTAPFSGIGLALARALTHQQHQHNTSPRQSAASLLACLKPGDILLVEGSNRIGSVIKYLTQSTWSHAALFVGKHLQEAGGNPLHCFIEVDLSEGVRSIGIEEFSGMHTRICRPIGMSKADRKKVANFAIRRIGNRYDLRNVIDLARFFLPTPPIPVRFRRKLLALGSGDPTRAICSTLIAQAFQSIHYPILPFVDFHDANSPECRGCVEEIYKIRHHSLFTPRDFDVSPYFRIIKPLDAAHFDFKSLHWE